SLLEAESMLRDADLAVGQRFGRAPSGIPTGTILAQVPRAGERVDKDTTVSIVVAVDEVEAIVPSVVGLTFSEADGAVRAVGLVLGLPEGAPADPATALVATQLPAAGGTTPPGSTVNVFFASVAAPSPPAGAVIVPSVLGLPFASAADALRVAGLVATLPSGMPADPAAPVTTQLPAAGEEVAESSTVDLFFESTPEPSPSPAPPVPAEPPTAPAPAPAPPPDGSTGAPDLLSPTLDALVPQELRSACTSLSDAPELSSGGVFCRADDDVEIWYFEFASHTDADGHYEQRVASAGAVRDRGTCGVDPTAESDATLLGNPVPGRLLCAPDDEGRPVIVFGDAELDAVVEARWSSDRPQAELLSWWLEGHALAPR
ncbi:MAG: PASTA domain-containing protein, partial [Gaiellales bacterium]